MSIVDRALALVEGPRPIPFVLVERARGGPLFTTLVTENSVRASILGRKLVAQHPDAHAYALAVDAFVRIGGERRDAIIVEHALAGAPTAEVVACPYTVTDGALSFGEPMPYRIRPSALIPLDPAALDWGVITPDFFDPTTNEATHVVNHALEVDDSRTVRFLRARAQVFNRHLPRSPPPTQKVVIDLRGQHIPKHRQLELANRLRDVMSVRFLRDDDEAN